MRAAWKSQMAGGCSYQLLATVKLQKQVTISHVPTTGSPWPAGGPSVFDVTGRPGGGKPATEAGFGFPPSAERSRPNNFAFLLVGRSGSEHFPPGPRHLCPDIFPHFPRQRPYPRRRRGREDPVVLTGITATRVEACLPTSLAVCFFFFF